MPSRATLRQERIEVVAHATRQRFDESSGCTEQRADRRVVRRVETGIDQHLEVGQQLVATAAPSRSSIGKSACAGSAMASRASASSYVATIAAASNTGTKSVGAMSANSAVAVTTC